MNGWDNQGYIWALIISNIIALVILFFAWKRPYIARLLLSILFIWAAYINWKMAILSPQEYVNFANLAFIGFYKDFIEGWFSRHGAFMIAAIATGQFIIGIAILLKGWIFRWGALGGIVFLTAIIPLGVGSGFPFPIIMASAFYLLLKLKKVDYWWMWRTH